MVRSIAQQDSTRRPLADFALPPLCDFRYAARNAA
jgi:hypothetical protein